MNDIFLYAIVIGIVLTIMGISSNINQLGKDVARISVTLDKIAQQMGVSDTIMENMDDELKTLILEGKRIKAIKKYRMITRVSLKEAKEYVDFLSKHKKM